jgi:hypothetical protein
MAEMSERQRASYLVDAARFFVFHPFDFDEDEAGDLDPPERAFEEGLVAGLHLGADGNRVVEVCHGPLPVDERTQMARHYVFRLDVRHGALYATDHIAGRGEYDWSKEPRIFVANGKYRATFWLLKDEAAEARNVSFVLSLEPVATFERIGVWGDLPHEDSRGGEPPPPAQPPPPRRVYHAKFGEGTVVREEPGPKAMLIVRFADGERKLLASFITPLDQSED